MSNENIPSLDTVARALAESGGSLFQLSVAFAKAQTRIKELEAQAAMLAGALTASERWMGTFLAAFSVGKLEPNHPILQARHILANLPQAVQQHLERDRAADRMVKLFAEMATGDYVPTAQRARQEVAAYRAAGGEGV